jgi:hypothetical protein
VIPFTETSVVSKVVLVVMPEIFLVLTVMMLVIMMILVLLGMVVAGFQVVVSEAVRMTVMGISLLIIYSNWVVDICWTRCGREG